MKNAIVVLTRGYSNYNSYSKLILRNKQIETYLQAKETDILIFHEGNIVHQEEICKETPSLKITFVDVKKDGLAFKEQYENIQVDPETSGFGIGYRHMCSFWFVDFWHFVKEYDAILRIDEDCFIQFIPDFVFKKLQYVPIVTGLYEKDEEFVTKSLNHHTLQFITEKTGTSPTTKSPSGPYTNLCGFSLCELRTLPLLKEYIESVRVSNQIYIQRWGDLPLWGEVNHYLLNNTVYIDPTLSYFHESHCKYINPS
jgi:hypothetical protein